MKLSLVILLGVLMLPGLAVANGGKKRLGDELIDEVYQLCQQAGLEEGVITVEVCSGPDDGNCVVTRVDCSQAPED